MIIFRILGGSKIDIEEAPYTVNYGDICGGVIIHQKWVLTTAHCGKEHYIRIGDKHRLDGPKVKIRQHIIHPKFGKKHAFDYDVQLLQLYRRLRMTSMVQTIEINDGIYGDHIYIAGWGYAEEKGEYQKDLHQVKLKMVPFKKCQNADQKWYNNTLTTRMFCAGGDREHDACQGDSGGAAVSIGRLVGIASFGFRCDRNYPSVYINGDSGGAAVSIGRLVGIASFGFGCGRNYPGVYINVSETRIREWIHNYTGV